MAGACVIEIDDAGLAVSDAAGRHAISPGYAVLSGKELLFGEAARARARLDPRRTFDRYWERLDQQPLNRAAGPARSHADLAYYHLRELWTGYQGEADKVLLLVPPGYDSDQLALLLGIAQACGMPVAGLAAAPVAAAAAVDSDRPRLVLQAHLHRISAVRIQAGDEFSLGETRIVTRRGLADLDDAWAGLIAERFVHETRFDPLHDAATEQTLYDHLPEWLAALGETGSTRLTLGSRLRSHHVDIEREALAGAAESVYTPLLEAAAAEGDAQVVLDHRLASLPALRDRLAERCTHAPVALAAGDIAGAALAHAGVIRSDAEAPAYVTRLPVSSASSPDEPETGAPTHLLYGWRAYPVGARPLAVPPESGAGGRIVARDGGVFLQVDGAAARVNDAEIEGDCRLAPGDWVEIDGTTMRLIVVTGDGPA